MRIKAAFEQRPFVESGSAQINRDKMQSFNSDFRTGANFVTLRRRMIYLPKSRTSKFLMQLEAERIKPCSDYDDLCSSIEERCAQEPSDTFLSQGVVQQDSWDRDVLEQLRDRSKPALSNNFQKQTRLWRIGLKHLSTEVCRSLRDEVWVFWIPMQKNQTRGNEQCRATSVFVLHSTRVDA